MIFLEHLALYNTKGDVPSEEYTIPFGKANITKEGTDLTVISYSRMASVALDVARACSRSRTSSIEVVDLRSLRPLDKETIIALGAEDGSGDCI